MLRIDVLPVIVCGALALAPVAIGQARALPLEGQGRATDPRQGSPSPSGGVPEGLSATDWSGIREAWEGSRHAAVALDGGFQAHNPGQGWRTRFDGRGFTTEPDAGGWSWGLQLERYGFAGGERAVGEPREVNAAGQRVAYGWDGILEEWYVNDTRGLEHGFTLHQLPPLVGRSEPCPLTFLLSVRGELRPEVAAGGRDVRFLDGDGEAVLLYSGLSVLDADGRELVAGFERVAEGLLLSIDERGARYPLTIDPVAQQAYLKASNTGSSDQLGWSVSMSGNTMIVGAPTEDSSATGVNGDQSNDNAFDSGAAYVFVRSGTTWSQQAYLKASNTGSSDQFGSSVWVSGDTVVVGSPFEDSNATGVNGDQNSNGAFNAGAAYVFVRSGTSWSQEAYLKASNTEGSDNFGQTVAVSGDTLVIGAQSEDSNAAGVNGDQSNNNASGSGAAYVLVRSGTTWSQQAYLKASNPESFDNFGASVAVLGDTVVVGATSEDSFTTGVNGDQSNNNAPSSGAAYVFARNGTTWGQEAFLKASNTDASDVFGVSLALSGETLVVGASSEDSDATGVNGAQGNNNTSGSGAAYVFVRNGTSWSQEAYLKASNTGTFDGFGRSVAISGDTVLAGAPSEDSNALSPYGDQSDNSAFESGAAYVFVRQGASWDQQAYLKPSNTGGGDTFGFSLAMSLDTAVVGAYLEDSNASGVNGDPSNNNAFNAGATYVFQICPQATVVFRNAGSNPSSYVASPAVIGTTFTATVNNNLAGQVSSLLFAFDTATSFPLGGGQTLLCIDFGNGELFTGGNLFPSSSSAGVDSYTLAIPDSPALVNMVVYSQAIQFGQPPFVLSNAQDITIGAF